MAEISLTAKARLLTSTIGKTDRNEALRQYQVETDRLRTSLKQKKNAILNYTENYREANKESIELSTDMSQCSTVGASVKGCVEQNRQKFDIDSVIDIKGELDQALTALKTAVDKSWEQIINAAIRNRSGLNDLVSSFVDLSGSDDSATVISGYLDEILILQRSGLNSDNLARLKEISAAITEQLKDLFGDDESVQEFANSIAKGGAKVDHLTPEVLTWLREKGFIDSFKIVPGFAHSEDDE